MKQPRAVGWTVPRWSQGPYAGERAVAELEYLADGLEEDDPWFIEVERQRIAGILRRLAKNSKARALLYKGSGARRRGPALKPEREQMALDLEVRYELGGRRRGSRNELELAVGEAWEVAPETIKRAAGDHREWCKAEIRQQLRRVEQKEFTSREILEGMAFHIDVKRFQFLEKTRVKK